MWRSAIARRFNSSFFLAGYLLVLVYLARDSHGFLIQPALVQKPLTSHSSCTVRQNHWSLPAAIGNHDQKSAQPWTHEKLRADIMRTITTAFLIPTIALSSWTMSSPLSWSPPPAGAATDSGKIVSCLVQKCPAQLGQCILNPNCLLNVACINTCNNRPDEADCQVNCGNLFENDVVGKFNKCAVSDMSCVPQKQDDGSYPVPSASQVVSNFDTKLFTGRWYITAGQNPLFDTFPCQVHFFSATGKDKFVGKLNWRIEEPDGEFFTRDALQAFVQDYEMPAHLLNHDNEYLHYTDDWYIIDYEYDDNPDKVPPFAFVYYRGSNDAWDGYGGAVVYTRDAALPKSLLPRLRAAAKKVNYDFDKDFRLVDNSCPTELSEGQKTILREKFAGNVLLQTEKQLQAQAVRLRGNANNSAKAQKIFFEGDLDATSQAFNTVEETRRQFELDLSKGVEFIKEVVKEGQEATKEAFEEGKEAIKDGQQAAKKVSKKAVRESKEVLKDGQEAAKKATKEAVQESKEVLKDGQKAAKDVAQESKEVAKDVIKDGGKVVKETAKNGKNAAKEIEEKVVTPTKEAVEDGTNAAKNVGDKVLDPTKGAAESGKNAAKEVGDKVVKSAKEAVEVAKNAAKEVEDKVLEPISN